jgi:hypothetical protein
VNDSFIEKGKVPTWLVELGVREGQYFIDSKLRAKRAMQSRCFSRAARVHICLGLHTMGFQQQLAIKLVAGERVPIGTSDIAHETGLHKQNVRPALRELRAAGLADVKGSTKGRLEIFAWAVPRPALPQNGNSRNYHFDGAPPELQALLSRYKISLPHGFVLSREYLDAVEDAARKCQNAEMVLKSALKGNRASEPSNKEERNETNVARKTPSSLSQIDTPEKPTTTVSECSKSSPGPDPRMTELNSETSAVRLSRVVETEPVDPQRVLIAVGQYARPDMEGVQTMIARCRANTPDVTEEEILEAVHVRGPTAQKCNNPFGFLITYVPKSDFLGLREKRRNEAESRVTAERRAQAEWDENVAQFRAFLDNPNASEEDKNWARRMLELETPVT